MLENDRERKKDDKKENRGIILSGIECFLIEVLCLERCISGHIVFLGIRHFILTDQGKDKPFFRVSQSLLTEDYYSPLQQTVQSATVDCTVCRNRLYSPLWKSVVIRLTDRHNRKDGNA